MTGDLLQPTRQPPAGYGDPQPWRVAVVVPCYRVRAQILDVLGRIGPECALIVVVDDGCPEGPGELARSRLASLRS